MREKIDLVITRHRGLVEYLKEEGLIDDSVQVVSHATGEMVRDKVVLGNLPFYLAALAKKVIVPVLELRPEDRGKDLTKEQVRARLRGLNAYIVVDLGSIEEDEND